MLYVQLLCHPVVQKRHALVVDLRTPSTWFQALDARLSLLPRAWTFTARSCSTSRPAL